MWSLRKVPRDGRIVDVTAMGFDAVEPIARDPGAAMGGRLESVLGQGWGRAIRCRELPDWPSGSLTG